MKSARPLLRSFALATLVVALPIFSWYMEEDYRGAKLWADTRRDLEARGESFDLAHFIPPAVPDEQNLAFAPFFAQLYQYRVDPVTGLLTFNHDGNTNAGKITDTIPFGTQGGPVSGGPGWQTGRRMELEKFQQYYRGRADFPHAAAAQSPADDVLLALTRFAPMLDELAREAARRPLARFPVNWTQKPSAQISLPHDNLIQKLIALLRLRACALLTADRNDDAFRDVMLGFRLRQAIASEPTVIASLVDVTCCGLLLQPVWEGLAEHRWSATQLEEIQTALSRIDFIANYQNNVRSERPFFVVPFADDLRQTDDLGRLMRMLSEGESDKDMWPWWMNALKRLFPRGWYDEAKAVAVQMSQDDLVDRIDGKRQRMDARGIDDGDAWLRAQAMKPSTFVAKICLPVHASVSVKIAYAQSVMHQAVLACALERFHLDRQAYPPALDALVPAYLIQLPVDVINGAAMHFQLTPAGRYRLWEVGWNQLNEKGKVVFRKGSSRTNEREGDWTWQYDAVQLPTGPLDKP